MPWKECNKMSERIKFIGRLLDGEKMTDLCSEFGISRVTGHKILNRYEADGIRALTDRTSRPWRLANKTPGDVERAIIDVKAKHPTWGAPKILHFLARKNLRLKLPVRSTVHAILDRHGLVKKRNLARSKYKVKESSLLIDALYPNQLWCADFKGQFKMGNGQYCFPLTITDQYSRYLIGCEALESVKEKTAIENFKRTFAEYGMPEMIRTDNGAPFAARSLFGLSQLSVLWLRLGIKIERIMPARPDQNGRHERMHRTMKQQVTKPPGKNLLQQQEMLDNFATIFNNERPHEGLNMKCPADVYKPSAKAFPGIIEEYDYSKYEHKSRVSACGSLHFKGRKIFVSEVFAGQELGLETIDDGVLAVDFMDYRIGYTGPDTNVFNPATNPFLTITKQNM